MKVVFAHGFEGRPNGSKAEYLSDTLDLTVVAPLMNRFGWGFEDHVRSVLEALTEHPDARVLIGSSLGGFASAVALSRLPELDIALLLLAPAVGIGRIWTELFGTDVMARWKTDGVHRHFHQGVGRMVDLPYRLFTECVDNGEVVVSHPCVIIHGLRDDVVPYQNSVRLAERSPGVRRLIGVEDTHRLTNSLPVLASALDILTGEAG